MKRGKFSPAILSLLASEVAHADFFRNEFLSVGHVRTDAIISPDCLSDHVHTFYGPPLLYPKVTFEDLRNSDPSLSSGNIEENLSLYWHPSVYHVAADGKKTLQGSGMYHFCPFLYDNQIFHYSGYQSNYLISIIWTYSKTEMTTIYYNWIPGQTTAFPAGLRMVTPGENIFDKGITPGGLEMELSISFQSCWDGVNLDSPDHMSHVAFPQGEEDDAPCPSSHPVRFPRLDFFIRFFNTKAAKWRFSDGSRRFHADYISGWDESFLQSLLDGGDGDVDGKVTFRAGIKHEGSDSDLVQQLKDNAVPKAYTSCLTTEIIDNIVNLPRGECTGTLISPLGVCGAPTPTPQIPPSPTPTLPPSPVPLVAPTIIPSSSITDNLCSVIDVLGQTLFIAGAGACWRVQLAPGGTLEGDFSDLSCSKNESDWQSSNGVYSIFDSVSLSKNTAVFINGTNGFSGTFQFKSDSAVTQPMLEVLDWNQASKQFVLQVTIPTCSANAICPTMKVDL